MKTEEIEYYDRTNDYHGIGSFVQLNDLPIQKGTKFIVPAAALLSKSTAERKNWLGCSEGRANHSAYLKPLLLECKAVVGEHIVSVGYGAWRKDLCYIELE
jgi:hypothetical protein